MNTPSHWLIQAGLAKRFKRIRRTAFLWGSVAPDLPLYVLSLFGALYYLGRGMPLREALDYVWGTLFFESPFWVASHNLLHSPTMLLLLAGGWWLLRRSTSRDHPWFIWFILGCALHTAVDIPTHHDDGPLLLFPFNWTLRFISPVSYWDPEHYGDIFAPLELLLDGLLLAYLTTPWLRRRFGRS